MRQHHPGQPKQEARSRIVWRDASLGAAHELRAQDLEPEDIPRDRDTTWSWDLDDPYAWADLPLRDPGG